MLPKFGAAAPAPKNFARHDGQRRCQHASLHIVPHRCTIDTNAWIDVMTQHVVRAQAWYGENMPLTHGTSSFGQAPGHLEPPRGLVCAARQRDVRTSGVTRPPCLSRECLSWFLCVLVKPSVAAFVGVPPVVHHRAVGDGEESQTESTLVLHRTRWSSRYAKGMWSVEPTGKLVVEPSVTVSRGLCLAASHDISYDSLFNAMELSPVKLWLDRHAKESTRQRCHFFNSSTCCSHSVLSSC